MLIGLLLLIGLFFGLSITRIQERNTHEAQKSKTLPPPIEIKKPVMLLGGLAFFMLAFSFASVPLYRIFCQKTGFGGTPMIVDSLGDRVVDRVIRVQFNADTHRNLPWKFKPLQHEITVRAGEPAIALYKVKNVSNKPIIGIASYNVSPDKVAPYFMKVKCFCFDEQRIEPGQELEMPVQFFIDPEIADNKNVDDVKVLTLSYTFFEAKDFDWGLWN